MYEGVANSAILYGLVIVGLVAILGFSFIFFRKSYKRCREFGMSKENLSRIIRSSLLFSVVPSISIVIGLFTLSAVFDIPWPWWRLSVIGSVGYELMAGDTAAKAITAATGASGTPSVFVAVMFGMTLGVTGWIFGPVILGKKLGSGIKKGEGQNPGWSMVLNSTFWTAMMCVFIPLLIFGTPVQAAVLFTSAVISTLLGIIAGKTGWKWLNECNLAFTLILGMLSSLFWTSILG